MMVVNILDAISGNLLKSFPIGTYVLGRGDLQCNDKRVSRSHASLEVDGNGVKLTSIHINPCFLKTADTTIVSLLSKDSSTILNEGDKFAFLPDAFWFKIQVADDGTENGVKRHSESITDESTEKRIKTEIPDVATENLTQIEERPPDNYSSIPETEVERPPDSSSAPETSIETEIKKEAPELLEHEQTSAAGPSKSPPSDTKNTNKVRRDRCWYGSTCYRKNPPHRADFSHPGDEDYDSDPTDDRPSCSYGAACYRRNPIHRREYKHPRGKPPSRSKMPAFNIVVNNIFCPHCLKKQRRKRAATGSAAGYEDLLGEEEEDPFQADGDSDEYIDSGAGTGESDSE